MVLEVLIVFIYFIGLFVINWFFGSRSKSARELAVGYKKIPFWALGLSIFGTYISSISFLSVTGKAYAGNWTTMAFVLSLPLAGIITSYYFIDMLTSSSKISCYGRLDQYLGRWATIYCSLIFIFLNIGRVAVIIFLISQGFSYFSGIDFTVSTGLIFIVVVFYSAFGGFHVVVWTDVIQSIFLILGITVSLGLLLKSIDISAYEILWTRAVEEKVSLGGWGLSLKKPTFFIVLIFGFFENIRILCFDQATAQRYMSAQAISAARKAMWLAILMTVPIYCLFSVIGTMLFIFLDAGAAGSIGADQAFLYYIFNHTPPLAKGIIIAGLLGAAMSSVDSSLNSSSVLIAGDFINFYNFRWIKQFSQRSVYKTCNIVLGFISAGLCFVFLNYKTILDVWWEIMAFSSAGLLGLFGLSLFCAEFDRSSNKLSFFVGILSVILLRLFANEYILPILMGVVGVTITLFCGLVFGRFSRTKVFQK